MTNVKEKIIQWHLLKQGVNWEKEVKLKKSKGLLFGSQNYNLGTQILE